MREFAEGARPVLLLALQDDNDMCVYPHLPKIFDGSYQAWVSAILESVPKEWKVIVKKHPLASFAVDSKNPNHFFADRVKLQSAMEMSDVVLSLSSLVCLEAAFGGKAAIVCGRPYYAGKGITLDMSAEGQTGVLPEFLRKAREFVPPERKLFMFAKRLFEDYQIDGNDGDKFRQLIANAMERKPQITDNLSRPFF